MPLSPLQCHQHASLSGDVTVHAVRKLGSPKVRFLDQSTATKQLMISYSIMWVGANVKEGCYTKVVRARSDQGLRFTDNDQSEESEDQALISAITFCPQHCITIHSQSQKLAFV